MASALLLLRSGVMASSITLLKRRMEGGHGLCLLLPGKWMSLGRSLDGNAQFLVRHWGSSVISVSTMSNNNIIGQSLDGNGKGVTMAHGLPLPEGRVEGDHDLSPCPLEKWRIVASTLLKY